MQRAHRRVVLFVLAACVVWITVQLWFVADKHAQDGAAKEEPPVSSNSNKQTALSVVEPPTTAIVDQITASLRDEPLLHTPVITEDRTPPIWTSRLSWLTRSRTLKEQPVILSVITPLPTGVQASTVLLLLQQTANSLMRSSWRSFEWLICLPSTGVTGLPWQDIVSVAGCAMPFRVVNCSPDVVLDAAEAKRFEAEGYADIAVQVHAALRVSAGSHVVIVQMGDEMSPVYFEQAIWVHAARKGRLGAVASLWRTFASGHEFKVTAPVGTYDGSVMQMDLLSPGTVFSFTAFSKIGGLFGRVRDHSCELWEVQWRLNAHGYSIFTIAEQMYSAYVGHQPTLRPRLTCMTTDEVSTRLVRLQAAYPQLKHIAREEFMPDPDAFFKQLPPEPPFSTDHVTRPHMAIAAPRSAEGTAGKCPRAAPDGMPAVSDTEYADRLSVVNNLHRLAPGAPRGRGLLVLLPWLIIGGAEKFALNVISEFTQLGWHVTIVLSVDTKPFGGNIWLSQAQQFTQDIFVVPSFLDRVHYPALLCSLIRSRNVDSIITTNNMMPYLALPIIRHNCPVNTVIDVSHNWIDAWMEGGYTTFTVGMSHELDYTMVISDALSRKMVAEGADPSKLRTIYIGTNATYFTRESERSRPAQLASYGEGFLSGYRDRLQYIVNQPRARIVVFVGRQSGEKQPMVFVHAMALAVQALPPDERNNVYGLVVGGGYQLEMVRERIIELQVQANVISVGPQLEHTTKQILNIADIMMMTSETEGTPLAVFEAMSMGLAIIAPKVGGLPEMVSEDVGFLVDNVGLSQQQQAQEYSNTLQKMLRMSDQELEAMKQAAARRVREKFDTSIMARQLQALMDENRSKPKSKRGHGEQGSVSYESYLQAMRAAVVLNTN